MFRAAKSVLVAAALSVSALTIVAGPASAVTDYSSCTTLHRDFKYGVARSKAAANRQYNTGHYRPRVAPVVYSLNDESDADHDGTACEVSR